MKTRIGTWSVALVLVAAGCSSEEGGGDTAEGDASSDDTAGQTTTDTGGQGNDAGTQDTGTQDTGTADTGEDTGAPEDTSEDGAADQEVGEQACGAPTGGVSGSTYFEDGDFHLYMTRDGDPDSGESFDALSIEFYYDLGASAEAGTYTFTGQNYTECTTCSLAYTGCVQDSESGTIECEKNFLITEGLLTITANGRFGDRFTAILTDATYAEITFPDENIPFQSEFVTGGEERCVESFSIDTPLFGFGCGNGEIDGEEECDDGPLENSDSEPDACRLDCTNPRCGDEVTDDGEECDDGFIGSDTCTRGCKFVSELCGNGDLDEDEGEECDLGDGVNSDTEPNTCRTDCTDPICGDGVTDEGEDCDEGENNGKVHTHCSVNCNPCTYDDAPVGGPANATYFGGGFDQTVYVSRSAAEPGPFNAIDLGLFYDFGASDTLSDYADYDFADPPSWAVIGGEVTHEPSDYSECNTCSLGTRGCTRSAPELDCASTYLIQAGDLSLTSLGRGGDTLAGTLSNARYVEVTIDAFVATIVDENEDDEPDTSWCVESHTFDIDIVASE